MKKINSEFAEGDIRHFQAGIPVNHKTFGPGIVISITLFYTIFLRQNQSPKPE